MTGTMSLRGAAARLKRWSPRWFQVAREWHRHAISLRYRGDLVALADYYGTDKWNAHWYAEVYAERARNRGLPGGG